MNRLFLRLAHPNKFVFAIFFVIFIFPLAAQSFEDGSGSESYKGFELVDDMWLPDSENRSAQVGTLWTGGVVPYVFSSNVSQSNRNKMIDAMLHWEVAADLHFVPRTNQANYLFIQNITDPNICGSSFVGMIGGAQNLNMRCWTLGVMLHELGHALGLVHEHQRSDRDSYVDIIWSNIPQNRYNNFSIRNTNNNGDYDFLSIMHYHQLAFAITPGQPTIVAKDGFEEFQDLMGQREGLSFWDRSGMRSLYGISELGPIRTNATYFGFTINEGETIPSHPFQVFNEGQGALDYSVNSNSPWSFINPLEGTATSTPNTHQIIFGAQFLPPGNYVNIFQIVRFDGWSSVTLAIEVNVLEAPINIPDPQFEAYLLNNFDLDNDGFIRTSEAAEVTTMNCSGLGIENLTGLAEFPALSWLDASDNLITDMQPIWDNPSLTNDPDCSHYIDISNNLLHMFPGQTYCWLHCVPIGFVDASNQGGDENPAYCRCYDSTCD